LAKKCDIFIFFAVLAVLGAVLGGTKSFMGNKNAPTGHPIPQNNARNTSKAAILALSAF